MLKEVIAHNKSVAARAAELNVRIGEQRFSIMDQTALSTWLANRLQGARQPSEVKDWDVLRLPELDATLVAQTLAEPEPVNVVQLKPAAPKAPETKAEKPKLDLSGFAGSGIRIGR